MASHNNVDLLAAGIANNNGKAAISGKTSLNGVENGRYDLKYSSARRLKKLPVRHKSKLEIPPKKLVWPVRKNRKKAV